MLNLKNLLEEQEKFLNPKSTNCALFCEPVILGKSLLISPHTCKEDGIRVKEGQNSTLSLNE